MSYCGTPQLCYGQSYYDYAICTCRCTPGANLISFHPFYCDFGSIVSTSPGPTTTGFFSTISRSLRNEKLKRFSN